MTTKTARYSQRWLVGGIFFAGVQRGGIVETTQSDVPLMDDLEARAEMAEAIIKGRRLSRWTPLVLISEAETGGRAEYEVPTACRVCGCSPGVDPELLAPARRARRGDLNRTVWVEEDEPI